MQRVLLFFLWEPVFKRKTPVKTGGYLGMVEAAGIEPASACPLPAALHA